MKEFKNQEGSFSLDVFVLRAEALLHHKSESIRARLLR